MKTTSLRTRALACVLLATTAWCGLAGRASAQTTPTFRSLDPNGVDLVRGDFLARFPEGSIGSGEAELALLRMVGATGSFGSGSSQWDHILLKVDSGGAAVDFGTRRDLFPGAASRGATLSGSGASYQYRAPDGTVIAFTDPTGGGGDIRNFCDGSVQASCILVPTSVTSPDGRTVNLAYEFWAKCVARPPEGEPPEFGDPVECTFTPRLSQVSNSFGYSLTFAYASPAGTGDFDPPDGFERRTGASFANAQAGGSPLASVGYSYPSGGVTEITDMGGRLWRVTSSATGHSVRRPGATSDTLSVALSGGVVSSVTNEGVTTLYSKSASGSTGTMTVTQVVPGGTGPVTTIVSDLTIGRPTSVTDPLGRTTSFSYDSHGRLERTTADEGNHVHLTYDARGNVTGTKAVAKPGSNLPDIVTGAAFPCTVAAACNQPETVTDARGNVTEYTYDPDHGGLLTATGPAPTQEAIRPQTRYGYTLTNGEYRLTSVSQCRTLGGAFGGNPAACAGGADESRTSFQYDPNGNLVSTSSGDGSGALTATNSMTYDALGNLLTVDGPLAGTADTTRFRYNAARELVGAISPDPDGGGALRHRAVRNSYTNGFLTRVETGTVDSQSDSDWAAFAGVQEVQTDYENGRLAKQRLVAGGTTYALTQTSYDALGRVDCVVRRMDPADFGSPLPDACDLTTPDGPHGSDRIVRTHYDLAGQVTRVQVALHTADEADEVRTTYTDNGLVHTVTDGENNRTTYAHDGHDRLSRTYFPMPAQGSGESATPDITQEPDYEELVYETLAGGTLTSPLAVSFRNRTGETTAFTHDALGRMTVRDRPGSELDVSYAYDLVGQLTSVSHFYAITFGYDALGRRLTETSPHGTVASEYDLAGRRTKLTHPDGFFVNYDHLVTGEVEKIRENGATSDVGVLATFAYDDLGRRDSLTRGSGLVTRYDYDAVSRLTSLAHDFGSNGNDLTLTFAYNPAGQIVSRTGMHNAYVWTGHGSGSTASSHDGLNRITGQGGTGVGHDAKGNVSAIGSPGYSYTSDNLMVSAPGAGLYYDPLDRLRFVSGGGNEQRVYDGLEPVVEMNMYGTALLRRHVFVPGTDEPLVWYEGSGTSDRRWLIADERGSIVGAFDSSGGGIGHRAYDEYGVTQLTAGNPGRFGYTGQAWLPELGMYYYKARIYNPTLNGRFMQTDPLGYGDGLNPYVYAGGDPVNLVDPSGTQADDEESIISTGIPPRPAKPGGERIWDWMGIYGQAAGGRLEAMRYERLQRDFKDALAKLNDLSAATGISVACLLNERCSQFQLAGGAGRTAYVYDWQYESLQNEFLNASFVGSAAKALDPNVAFARNPIVFSNAVRTGTMFIIPSDKYFFGSVLLQAEISRGSRTGIVEYIMPRNLQYFLGSPIINHARFIAGAPISGYPNNFNARYSPWGVI